MTPYLHFISILTQKILKRPTTQGDDDFKLELGGKLWQRALTERSAKGVDTTRSAESRAREAC